MTADIPTLIADARRLEKDYGDSYEVMCAMSELATALEAQSTELAQMNDRIQAARAILSRGVYDAETKGEKP